jgi:excinuclease ABC subunit C
LEQNGGRPYLQFGGLQSVASASVDALCSIDGISQTLAQRIYDSFHHADDD